MRKCLKRHSIARTASTTRLLPRQFPCSQITLDGIEEALHRANTTPSPMDSSASPPEVGNGAYASLISAPFRRLLERGVLERDPASTGEGILKSARWNPLVGQTSRAYAYDVFVGALAPDTLESVRPVRGSACPDLLAPDSAFRSVVRRSPDRAQASTEGLPLSAFRFPLSALRLPPSVFSVPLSRNIDAF
jgi:hypothetical protein